MLVWRTKFSDAMTVMNVMTEVKRKLSWPFIVTSFGLHIVVRNYSLPHFRKNVCAISVRMLIGARNNISSPWNAVHLSECGWTLDFDCIQNLRHSSIFERKYFQIVYEDLVVESLFFIFAVEFPSIFWRDRPFLPVIFSLICSNS